MKKYLFWLLIPLAGLLLVGCDQLGLNEESNLKTIYVGPERVDCEGEGPQTCYLVKENPAEQWGLYYSEIDGFDYEPGYEYELIVSENNVENPPAGGSSITWTLEEVVSETHAAGSGSDETADAPTIESPPEGAEPGAEPPVQSEFVPITVEDIGAATVAPVDWPKMEDDPLLENAWGSGLYRFVAFHSVAGDDVPQAMATLLGTTVPELADGSVEGDYWEEEIGAHSWTMYAIDNSDVGLAQTVSMTEQDGTIYVISLFIETTQKDAVLQPILENFVIEADPEAVGEEVEAGDIEAEEGDSADTPVLIDTNWVLTAYDDGSGQLIDVMPAVEIAALFNADGRVSGPAGCNNYVSLYTVEENNLTVSLPAMTRQECVDPAGIMLLETAYLGNLTSVISYQIEGTELQLLDAEGKVILTYLAS